MADETNLDFTKLKNRKKKPAPGKPKPKTVYKEVVEDTSEASKPVAKQGRGRRTWKDPKVAYRRIAFDTPDASLQKLKVLLATKFYDRFRYQDELLNLAIDEFLEKYA